MDPSVLGTGSIVLARAASTVGKLQGRMPLPPGWAHRGYTLPCGRKDTHCIRRRKTVAANHLRRVMKRRHARGIGRLISGRHSTARLRYRLYTLLDDSL